MVLQLGVGQLRPHYRRDVLGNGGFVCGRDRLPNAVFKYGLGG